MLLNKEGHVFDCNQAVLRILKCPTKEGLLGRAPWQLSCPLQPTTGMHAGADAHTCSALSPMACSQASHLVRSRSSTLLSLLPKKWTVQCSWVPLLCSHIFFT